MGITPTVPAMGPIVMSNVARYPNLEYLAQDIDALRLLLWGETSAGSGDGNGLPIHLSHPLLRDDKSVSSWIRGHGSTTCARRTSCSGHAIHGSIAAVLSGTPSYLLATMRARWSSLATSTSRIARWRIHRPTSTPPTSMRRQISAIDGRHPERFRRFTGYLEQHGLRHVFQPGEDTGIRHASWRAFVFRRLCGSARSPRSAARGVAPGTWRAAARVAKQGLRRPDRTSASRQRQAGSPSSGSTVTARPVRGASCPAPRATGTASTLASRARPRPCRCRRRR
jgi:hypothetical protein